MTLRAGLRYNHDNGAQKNALDQLRGERSGADRQPRVLQRAAGRLLCADAGAAGIGRTTRRLVDQTRSQYLHNTAVTGRAGVDFNVTPDALLYVNYSKGYRSAAFNAQFLFTPSDLTTVKPESLDSYEAGFKTSWLDHRVQMDGAAFHYQYKNQQIIDVYPPGSSR